jgi:hypothetical protein
MAACAGAVIVHTYSWMMLVALQHPHDPTIWPSKRKRDRRDESPEIMSSAARATYRSRSAPLRARDSLHRQSNAFATRRNRMNTYA